MPAGEEPVEVAWIAIALIIIFGLFVVWLRARSSPESSPGPEPHREAKPAGRRDGALSLIGPTEPVTIVPENRRPADREGPSESPGRRHNRESAQPGPAGAPPLVIGPGRPLTIGPLPRDAWEEQGWVRHRNDGAWVYQGHYRVRDRHGRLRRFPGRVIVRPNDVRPYIADPPVELRTHPKGRCFMLVHAPWFQVHWHRPARNADEAILYIEKILAEALNGRTN